MRRNGREKKRSLFIVDDTPTGDGLDELMSEDVFDRLEVVFNPWDCSKKVGEFVLMLSNGAVVFPPKIPSVVHMA